MVCAAKMHSKIPEALYQLEPSGSNRLPLHNARRQLPPTPVKEPPEPSVSTSSCALTVNVPVAGLLGPVRRASSPRMLPTPPPSNTTNTSTIVTDRSNSPGTLMNNSFHSSTCSSPPSPPLRLQAKDRRPSTGRRLPSEPPISTSTSPSLLNNAATLPPTPSNNLYRSASARTATSQLKAAQLPPTAPRSSISSSEQSELESTAMNRLIPEPLCLPSTRPLASSAPQSPKDNAVELPAGYKGLRKCSFNADLGKDSLSRNGSMAHLLEQQHLLRKEFNATPESNLYSNPSSLSPSIEQLNVAGSSKDSSDGEDPNQHGLNPSLYGSKANIATTPDASAAPSFISVTQPYSNVDGEPRPKGLGLVYCALQHFPVRKRLKVSILRIEGLAGELRPDLEIQAFCKVNLVPGKQNKQQVSVVKRGRDIVYNTEFFFDNVPTEELNSKCLEIDVCHQSAVKIQKDLEIGQITIPLKEMPQLFSKKEVRVVEELKIKSNNKRLGKIYTTTCIEKEARRLTINVIKVDDLPKWGIIGAPDVCVRITLHQNKSTPQTKSTRVLKNTCSAVYKEAVMFLISTTKNDLQHTKITISVHDVSRAVTGDDVIGSAFLGELAVDKSEQEQWKSTVEKFNKEFKGNHQLKPPNQAPEVHVSEMHSDEEVEEEESADID